MSLRIARVDPTDDTAFAAWHHVYETSTKHELGEVATPWQLEELRVTMQGVGNHSWSGAWAAVADGVTVGAGWLRTPLLDNLELAELDVHVLPERRRGGTGSALLALFEDEASSRGRRPAGRARRRRGPRPPGLPAALVERARARRPARGLGPDHVDPGDRGAHRRPRARAGGGQHRRRPRA